MLPHCSGPNSRAVPTGVRRPTREAKDAGPSREPGRRRPAGGTAEEQDSAPRRLEAPGPGQPPGSAPAAQTPPLPSRQETSDSPSPGTEGRLASRRPRHRCSRQSTSRGPAARSELWRTAEEAASASAGR